MSISASNTPFQRRVDKAEIPICTILGVNIAAIKMEWLIGYLVEHLGELSGDYITVANVHTTVTAFEDKEYCAVQNNALMAIPDGGPLSSIGRKRGFADMSRTTGPGLMEEIFAISAEKGYRHYFYGSTKDTLDKLKVMLEKKYPGMTISGMYSPPFRALTDEEDAEIIRMINAADADFIWIGLGAPKQERWMAAHQGKLHGVMVGVGAGFDYFSGNIKRAPQWMQNHSLEWLYRLLQDPKRLLKRYLTTNFKFIWNVYILKK